MKTQSEIVVAGLGTWASHLLTNPCEIKARSNTHKVRWLRACAFIAQSVLGHIEAKICLEEEGRIQFNTADKRYSIKCMFPKAESGRVLGPRREFRFKQLNRYWHTPSVPKRRSF